MYNRYMEVLKMYYYTKREEKIEKYEITFDEEQLKKLQKEIIKNCSEIVHIKEESDYSPRFTTKEYNKGLIKNLNSKNIGTKEYFEETRTMYLYTYDRYIPPKLVELIDKLLDDDVTVLGEIFNYNESKTNEILKIEKKINKVSHKLDKIDNLDTKGKKKKLIELEELLEEKKKMEKESKLIIEYYNELISLIECNLIDSISIKAIQKVEEFLGIKSEINFVNTDVLKLELR